MMTYSGLSAESLQQSLASMESVSPETILIVDDTPNNLRLLAALLTERGYEVSVATSGAMALSRIHVIKPDLVLLDIRMPEIDGYEVCDRLKAQALTREIPVIFISAVNDTLDKVRAFGLGGADYITKPFQLEETLARVEHQLKIHRLHRRLEEQNIQLRLEIEQRRQTEQVLDQLNASLEQRIQERTAQLELAYRFEATLKRITDRVRDSLDEQQILQTVVQELAQATGAKNCNAALYDLTQKTSTVYYEYTNSSVTLQGQVLQMSNFLEGYNQLLQGSYFQFCSLLPNPRHGRATLLACPIVDDQGVLGDLWLVSRDGSAFSEPHLLLVQQVANQCAIALRQARLYQAAQAQVQALEQLNQLKDDFLSTISHELRTPLFNILLGTNILEIEMKALNLLTSNEKAARCLQILNHECQREIQLINDLLEMVQLDADTEPSTLTAVSFQNWLAGVVEPFQKRMHTKQQSLVIKIAPDLSLIRLQLFHLEHILAELLENACKFAASGETIVVAATITETEAREGTIAPLDRAAIAHSVLPQSSQNISPSGSWLQISVSNSGTEIPASELAKVFDKFYRVPSNDPWRHSGTGLGLALAKKRVEKLNGTIEAICENGWTTFSVTIPHLP